MFRTGFQFWPVTGRARQIYLSTTLDQASNAAAVVPLADLKLRLLGLEPPADHPKGDVELFGDDA